MINLRYPIHSFSTESIELLENEVTGADDSIYTDMTSPKEKIELQEKQLPQMLGKYSKMTLFFKTVIYIYSLLLIIEYFLSNSVLSIRLFAITCWMGRD